MEDKTDQPNPAAGAELMDATISVEHLESAQAEAKVLAALESLPGVRTVGVIEAKKVQITYDPTLISEAKLEEAIRGTGNQPSEGTTERDSPFAG